MANNLKAVQILLRIGIAGVFFYAAVAATLQPDNWIWYIPEFLIKIFPANILLLGFSAFQLLLGIWILSGWKSFYAGLLSSVTLVAIIIANIAVLDIVFRDFAILFAALALTVSSRKVKKSD